MEKEKQENTIRYCHECKLETQQYIEDYDKNAIPGSDRDFKVWFCTSCHNNIDIVGIDCTGCKI